MQNLFLNLLILVASAAPAQNQIPKSKSMTPQQISAIVKEAYAGFQETSPAGAKYKITQNENQEIIQYAVIDNRGAVTQIEQITYSGASAFCDFKNGDDARFFECKSVVNAPTEDIFHGYAIRHHVQTLQVDYIRFNAATGTLEKVPDPAKFEKEVYVKSCLAVGTNCSEVLYSIIWDRSIKDSDDTPGETLGLKAVPSEDLTVLKKLLKSQDLSYAIGGKNPNSGTRVLLKETFSDGHQAFVLLRDVYSDEGSRSYAVIGISKIKAPLYLHNIEPGKYTSCEPERLKDTIVMNCEGGEGGQSWTSKIIIDPKNRTIKEAAKTFKEEPIE